MQQSQRGVYVQEGVVFVTKEFALHELCSCCFYLTLLPGIVLLLFFFCAWFFVVLWCWGRGTMVR